MMHCVDADSVECLTMTGLLYIQVYKTGTFVYHMSSCICKMEVKIIKLSKLIFFVIINKYFVPFFWNFFPIVRKKIVFFPSQCT